MKNPSQVRRLTKLVSDVALEAYGVLVIDDEADQASLNTKAKEGDMSATYAAIGDLRSALPMHTYLQYTATPQAPLLIDAASTLAPDFVIVLDPGDGYVGGSEYFLAPAGERVHDIPEGEEVAELGQSLTDALSVFLLGCSHDRSLGGTAIRSMMVHPSRVVVDHAPYAVAVMGLISNWSTLAEHLPTELEAELTRGHSILKRTCRDLPSLADLMDHLLAVLVAVKVQVVNSTPNAEPPTWEESRYWVLVGGEMLNRGFTVEGLSVTHMSRALGGGQADTLQQRARFFGYKRKYFDHCHVWLTSSVKEGFIDYLWHERSLRDQLSEFGDTHEPLSEWKRSFVLDSSLKPTRSNVLRRSGRTASYADDWFIQRDVLFGAAKNHRLVTNFLSRVALVQHPEPSLDRHLLGRVDAASLLEDLLVPYVGDSDGSLKFTGLLCHLVGLNDRDLLKDEVVQVVSMEGGRNRRRAASASGIIENLFQGYNPRSRDQYPGDAAARASKFLTLQVHALEVAHESEVLARDVPALALWVPARLGGSVYTQVRR
jgi:hypothetical protein